MADDRKRLLEILREDVDSQVIGFRVSEILAHFESRCSYAEENKRDAERWRMARHGAPGDDRRWLDIWDEQSIDAALAKNPSPAHTESAPTHADVRNSGPVGLGPVEGVHRYQHVKRGTFYTGLFAAELQTETPLGDGAMLHIYRGDDGQIWARSMSEFNDGRFKLVETLSAGDSK